MKTGYEKAGMSASEETFYELMEEMLAKLDRIAYLLEKQGSVRAG